MIKLGIFYMVDHAICPSQRFFTRMLTPRYLFAVANFFVPSSFLCFTFYFIFSFIYCYRHHIFGE